VQEFKLKLAKIKSIKLPPKVDLLSKLNDFNIRLEKRLSLFPNDFFFRRTEKKVAELSSQSGVDLGLILFSFFDDFFPGF
jgi:hypothetical protein